MSIGVISEDPDAPRRLGLSWPIATPANRPSFDVVVVLFRNNLPQFCPFLHDKYSPNPQVEVSQRYIDWVKENINCVHLMRENNSFAHWKSNDFYSNDVLIFSDSTEGLQNLKVIPEIPKIGFVGPADGGQPSSWVMLDPSKGVANEINRHDIHLFVILHRDERPMVSISFMDVDGDVLSQEQEDYYHQWIHANLQGNLDIVVMSDGSRNEPFLNGHCYHNEEVFKLAQDSTAYSTPTIFMTTAVKGIEKLVKVVPRW